MSALPQQSQHESNRVIAYVAKIHVNRLQLQLQLQGRSSIVPTAATPLSTVTERTDWHCDRSNRRALHLAPCAVDTTRVMYATGPEACLAGD
jgi:hypothetical protein